MQRLALILSFVVLGSACGMGLDVYNEVIDLRVLALKAEPPEVFFDDIFDPLNPSVPNFASNAIRFDALVVDPREGPINYNWELCPVESGRACVDFDAKLENVEDEELAAAVRNLRQQSLSGEAQAGHQVSAEDDENARSLWPYTIDSFATVATPDLYNYHLADNLLGTLQGSWPSVVLTLESADEPEPLIAVKRFTINLRDPVGFGESSGFGGGMMPDDLPEGAPEIPDLGAIQLCASDDESAEDCLKIQEREQNRNPVIANVYLSDDTSPLTAFAPVLGTPTLEAGQSLRILPVLNADANQTFEKIRADFETFEIEVIQESEEVSVAWFASTGTFNDALTWPNFTASLDNVYNAPDAVPEAKGGMVTIYMVAQDQRGGVDWAELNVLIVP